MSVIDLDDNFIYFLWFKHKAQIPVEPSWFFQGLQSQAWKLEDCCGSKFSISLQNVICMTGVIKMLRLF